MASQKQLSNFLDKFVNGQLIEQSASTLNDNDRMYLGVFLVAGGTTEALQLFMGQTPDFKAKRQI